MKEFKAILAFLALLSLTVPWYGTELFAQTGDSQEVERYINSLKDSLWQIRWHAVTAKMWC